ncbi:PepSY domain-containing protein [Microcystis aeruginosa]|uniref:Putative Propeptide, PepSY amd peptidase M4 n=1 Tax=Microcystis aeruginosa PCC 9443 TaxID=1160281 RepID=I4G507_MICAE|nr:PepSY domain-containing protein [Microcystis aeruginosa]CCI03018.1 putative Propeptide, PepSY amd peptidase M4 [Microcystis aeruginosa PCC 9443]
MQLKLKWLSGAIALTSMIGVSQLVWAQPSPVVLVAQHSKPEEVNDANEQQNSDLKEQQQILRLQSQARITLTQAIQKAEAAQGGSATSGELETENGSLIYAVSIGQKEVIVDAGNGRILATEELNQPEKLRPQWRGSIHVSENSMGDGDGETQDDG